MGTLKKLSFTINEYMRRIKALQNAMETEDVDVVVCHNLSSICYFTGFRTLGSYSYGHYAAIVPKKGEPILFTSEFESYNAKIFSWVSNILVYTGQKDENKGPIYDVADVIKEMGYEKSRVGYEAGHFSLTAEEFIDFNKALPNANLIKVDRMIDELKIVKSDEEICVLRKAADITSGSMLAAVEATKTAKTDNEIAAAAYDYGIKNGSNYFSLQPVVTMGTRSSIPHSTFRGNPVEKNKPIFVEVSATYERYSAPLMRTLCIGKPKEDVRRAANACYQSVSYLIDNMKAGINGKTLAIEAGKIIRSAVPEIVWHGCYAYSVGVGFPPSCTDLNTAKTLSLTESFDYELKAGMVMHCSTSLRSVGNYGVTHSETVLITESGCEKLTNVPPSIILI